MAKVSGPSYFEIHVIFHSIKELIPTILYEDNKSCITQTREGYSKRDQMKHMDPKIIFTHEHQQSGKIDVCQTRSCEHPADLFTKALPTSSFDKLVNKIALHKLRDIL